MSANTEPADVARLTQRLDRAGAALRDVLALLPVSVHGMAAEMAIAGARCSPPPNAADLNDAAAMLLRYGALARARRAPVLRLREPHFSVEGRPTANPSAGAGQGVAP